MLNKLKEVSALAYIYEKIGEEKFQEYAEGLIILLCITPVLSGFVNYVMLLDVPSYDPYLYNDACLLISEIGFVLMLSVFMIYVVGKTLYNRGNIVEVINRIKQREPWLLFWLCLLLWGIITSVSAVDIRGAFVGVTELSSGYVSHVFMICLMGCAYLVNCEGRMRIVKVHVIVADFLAMVMLSLEYNIPFFYNFTGYCGCSVFTNSNHYGYYLAMSLPLMAGMFYVNIEETQDSKKGIWSIIYILSFAINMWAMVINDCMGGFLGVFFALVFMLIFWKIRRRKLGFYHFLPMIILIIFVYLSYIGVIKSLLGTTTGTSLAVLLQDIFNVAGRKVGYEKAGSNRILLWKQAIEAISNRPILGYGPDMMYDRWGQPVVSMTPHNEFLECALFMGIPGLVMYLGGLIYLFVNRVRKLKELPFITLVFACSVIGYQISAFFGVRKFHTVAYLFMFIGFLLNKEQDKENSLDE